VPRRRLDTELVRRGLVTSRSEAQDAVRGGLVLVHGRPAEKASTLVDPSEPLELVRPARRFVSRGGEKLDAAIEAFAIVVARRRCLDVGASTGGFTDCLLRRGAVHVVALDVGYGQLAWSLRRDPRVTVLERTNVRDVGVGDLPYAPDLVVADLSFISLRSVVPVLGAVAAPAATFVLLVKPQFEAGRGRVGRGGVVRDPQVWREAILGAADACSASGIGPRRVIVSPLLGPSGNAEFLLHAEGGRTGRLAGVDEALEHGRRLGGLG
jgi:23S rRNA (cytidine1920-2'-O)/16S rRNA (cytidine1409-2'-O)-methyltransferase